MVYEQFDAGDSIDLIAQAYDLDRDAAEEALRYEAPRRKEAPPGWVTGGARRRTFFLNHAHPR